jgi:hypothetical protein
MNPGEPRDFASCYSGHWSDQVRISTAGKRELFSMLATEIARQLKKKRVTEKAVLQDFERWKKAHRETRRRR